MKTIQGITFYEKEEPVMFPSFVKVFFGTCIGLSVLCFVAAGFISTSILIDFVL